MVFRNGALFPGSRAPVNAKTKKKKRKPVPNKVKPAPPPVIKEEPEDAPIEAETPEVIVVKDEEPVEEKKPVEVEPIPEPEEAGPKSIEDEILEPPAPPVKKKRKYTKRKKTTRKKTAQK